MKIGVKIRNAREDLDMSQQEVADLIPMNQSNYSKIERDFQEPNLEQLKRICEILSLDPAYLLEIEVRACFDNKEKQVFDEIKRIVDKNKEVFEI